MRLDWFTVLLFIVGLILIAMGTQFDPVWYAPAALAIGTSLYRSVYWWKIK